MLSIEKKYSIDMQPLFQHGEITEITATLWRARAWNNNIRLNCGELIIVNEQSDEQISMGIITFSEQKSLFEHEFITHQHSSRDITDEFPEIHDLQTLWYKIIPISDNTPKSLFTSFCRATDEFYGTLLHTYSWINKLWQFTEIREREFILSCILTYIKKYTPGNQTHYQELLHTLYLVSERNYTLTAKMAYLLM